jgi:hypothetical protein
MITIKNINKHYIDFTDICDIYGNELGKDIFPFINENDDSIVENTNRFYKNKIIYELLSKDICYWIINESEKLNKWDISPYTNYNSYLCIDKLPHILNFILFIYNFWKLHIYKLYNLPDNLKLNIKDIFVSKFTKKEEIETDIIHKNTDDNFLILTIFLNDITDYIDGEIIFDNVMDENTENNDEKIKLNIGDAFIHNGKKPRTTGFVKNGSKYLLTIFFNIQL